MALTTNQFIVGMMNVAVGGYKADVAAFIAAEGIDAGANALINQSGLNPQFLGTNLYNDAAFANAAVARLMPTLSTANAAAVSTLVVDFMAQNPTLTRGQIVVKLIESLIAVPASDPVLGASATAYLNKVALADAYMGTSLDLTELSAVIGAAAPATGQTFTLTKGVDTLTGTAGNDTFVGDSTVDAVISPADTVNGGSGSDTLNLYVKTADPVDTIALPQLTSIENLSVNNGTLTTGNTLNVSAIAGLESVTLDSPVAIVDGNSFTIKTTAAQNVVLKNVTGAGDALVTLDGAVKATVNGVKSALPATKAVTIDVKSEAAAFTLNAMSAASTITLTNSAAVTKMATLNVTGDKGVTITESLITLKTVDASANTGGVTLKVGATVVDLAFTGGSGKDSVVINGAQFNAKDVLNGGAGTDTIVLSDTTVAYAGINKAVDFEVLGLAATSTTVDVGQITNGINQFAINTGGTAAFAATVQNALSTSKFSINNDSGNGAIAIGTKVGESATTVSIDNQSAASQTIGSLDVSGANAVALSSTGKAGSANVITALANADNSTIVVTGSTDLTISTGLVGTVTGSKFDASAFTGKISVNGSGKADILIGGSGADTIEGGAGADTITGNGGADKFVLSQAVTTISSAAQADVVTDFMTKSDTIKIGVAGTLANYKEAAASVADFATAMAAADALFTGDATVVYSVQQVGSDSWVFYAAAASIATEQVVKLTGVALTGVEFGDFVA